MQPNLPVHLCLITHLHSQPHTVIHITSLFNFVVPWMPWMCSHFYEIDMHSYIIYTVNFCYLYFFYATNDIFYTSFIFINIYLIYLWTPYSMINWYEHIYYQFCLTFYYVNIQKLLTSFTSDLHISHVQLLLLHIILIWTLLYMLLCTFSWVLT